MATESLVRLLRASGSLERVEQGESLPAPIPAEHMKKLRALGYLDEGG